MTTATPDPDHPDAPDPANWASVEKLYLEHQNDARRAALWILGGAWLRDEAEDVVHDAVVKAARSIRTLKDPTKARPWFLKIVSRVAYDRVRKQRRTPMADVDITSPDADREQGRAMSTALAPEQAPELQLAWEFVNSLPDKQREAYILEHFFGLTRNDIGEVLRCSPRTVGTHIRRAQAKATKTFTPPTPETDAHQVPMRRRTA